MGTTRALVGRRAPAHRLLLVLALTAASWAAAAAAEPPRPDRHEIGGTPVLTGDSDIGIGVGAMGTLARFDPGHDPYRWRIEVLALLTIKPGEEGVELPYHDYYVKLDLPGLLGGGLRLDVQAGFSRFSNSSYYGMGNASPALDDEDSRFHQYIRTYPRIRGRARLAVWHALSLLLGATVTYNALDYYWRLPGADGADDDAWTVGRAPGRRPGKLWLDLQRGDGATTDLLLGTGDHALVELDLGWIWDSRDHETAPSRGLLAELSWRFCPATTTAPNVAYGGLNLHLRQYHPLWSRRLVLAARLMVDLLVGRPPFYALAEHGGLYPKGAIGGGTSVRGVPLQRYHGKVKLLGNVELRARLLPFSVWSQRFVLGAVAFADAGRTFAGYGAADRRLDGEGAGIKVGLGGGLRLQWGETFLLRADAAWSPDARPVGVYVDLGHVY